MATEKNHYKSTLTIVDISSFIFRAFFGIKPLHSPQGEPVNAVFGVAQMLLQLLEKEGVQHLVVAYDSPQPNFRHALFADYKAHRHEAPEALVPQFARVDELITSLGCHSVRVDGYEADDCIATFADYWRSLGPDRSVVIVSGDKDLMQLVDARCTLLDTMIQKRYGVKEVQEKFGVLPGQIRDYLSIVGDASDNIPGIAGIGPKGACALLEQYGTLGAILDAQIDGRRGQLVQAGAKNALLSYELVGLRRDVPCELGDTSWGRACFEREQFLDFCQQMGFVSIQRRFMKKREQTETVFQPFVGEAQILWTYKTFVVADNDEQVCILQTPPQNAIIAAWDCKSLGRGGHWRDLMIASYVLDPDLGELGSLKRVLEKFHIHVEHESEYPKALRALWPHLESQLHAKKLWWLFETVEMPFVHLLQAMEVKGIGIDHEALVRCRDAFVEEQLDLEKRIKAYAKDELNVQSPKQLAQFLYVELGLPPQGKGKNHLTTDAEALAALAPLHEVPALLVVHREVTKLLHTYILPLLENTERVHTTFHQTLTATGRLSSTNPNVQNIPIRSPRGQRLREAFCADPGHVLVSADYSQIELRLLAHMSEDPVLCAAFAHHEDIHEVTARELFGSVSPEQRRIAKAINFGLIYGKGAFSLSQELKISRQEAQGFIDRYFERYQGVKLFLERQIEQASRDLFVTSLLGRRRFLPDLASKHPVMRQHASRMALNTPLQSSAADLMKVAMLRIESRLRADHLKSQMILQVHDEIMLECPLDEREHVQGFLGDLLCQGLEPYVKLRVPLEVHISWGERWSDLA